MPFAIYYCEPEQLDNPFIWNANFYVITSHGRGQWDVLANFILEYAMFNVF